MIGASTNIPAIEKSAHSISLINSSIHIHKYSEHDITCIIAVFTYSLNLTHTPTLTYIPLDTVTPVTISILHPQYLLPTITLCQSCAIPISLQFPPLPHPRVSAHQSLLTSLTSHLLYWSPPLFCTSQPASASIQMLELQSTPTT